MISHKKYYFTSGLVGFFGTIAAILMDIPTTMSIATGIISPFKNSIVLELALLYIFLIAILFLKTSRAKKKEVYVHGTRVHHEYLFIFTHSLLSFIAGGVIGILAFFTYFIIGFRMINPHF
jgi:hypothetical protein